MNSAGNAASQSMATKAMNWLRSPAARSYVMSTHFWGPVSNFGIPLAAVADLKKDPNIISGPMTVALIGYSTTFMRYSMAVTPKNYLLLGCHIVNSTAQVGQAIRYVNYHYLGGKSAITEAEKAVEHRASKASENATETAKDVKDSIGK